MSQTPPNAVRKSGEGKSFWPQVIRVKKGQHPLYPEFGCLVAILRTPTCPDEQQKLVDSLHAAAQEGAVLTTDPDTMRARHWVVPEPGELVLARVEGDISNGGKDTVVGLARTASSLAALVPDADKELKLVQEKLLGARDGRNGTAAIEKSKNSSQPGHQGQRCYTIGTSVETGTRLMGPAANVRRGDDGSEDQYWRTLSDIVQTLADIHTEAILSALAPEDADLLARRGEYVNAPALGSSRRHLVGGMQVNVTGVSCRTCESHNALGSAAAFHTDNNDDFRMLSALTNLSDIDSDFAHGFFLLLEYGIAFEWQPLLTILASGRALHVSSPPLLRVEDPTRQPRPWELRLMVISYPSHNVLTRAVPTILSSHPNGSLVLPSSTIASCSSPNKTRPHRSWATDGGNILSEQNHVIFLAREMLTLAQQTFSQVPSLSARARIDVRQFLSSFQILADATTSTDNMGATSSELWVPIINDDNLEWNHGPWSHGHAGFAPTPAPDLSGLSARSKAGFLSLLAKEDGIVPAREVKGKGKRATSGEKAASLTPNQKALVNRLLAKESKSSQKRKPESDFNLSPRTQKMRKCKENVSTAVYLMDSENESVVESEPNGSDDDEYMQLDCVASDEGLEVDPPIPAGFPFLSRFSISSLILALSDAQNHSSSLEKGSFARLSASSTAQRSQSQILEFSSHLLQYDPATNAGENGANYQPIGNILSFWAQVGHLESYLANNWFVERRVTAALMISSWRVWFWIEHLFRKSCAGSLATHEHLTWVGRLIHKALDHTIHRRTTLFERNEFLPLPSMPIQLTQRGLVSGSKALDTAVQTAVCLMHKWMQFPVGSDSPTPPMAMLAVSPPKSRFIHLILSTTLNADILLLPALQDAWRRLSLVVFNQRRETGLLADQWNDLADALDRSLIGDSESSIGALICAHATVCTKWPKSQVLEAPLLTQHDLRVLQSCTTHAGAIPDLSDSWEQYNNSTHQQSSPNSTITQPPIHSSLPGNGNNSLPTCLDVVEAASQISSFLRDFHILVTDNINTNTLSSQQQQWLQRMSTHKKGILGGQDFYCPLRESAYSRRRITSPLGPYVPEFIRTPGGFFSALVFRGITFCSPRFLERSHNNRFASLVAWEAAVQDAKSSGLLDSDICNMQAYGSAQRTKSIDNARAYWNAATSLWANLLNLHQAGATGKIPWKEGYAFLRRESPDRQRLLPEIGPLTSFLLAIDLVYAGVFEQPTLDEFATIVWKVNLGGRKGLERLKLVTAKASLLDFQNAWRALYNGIDQTLTSQEKSDMGWNLFVLEHALCKAKRLSYI